MRQGNNRIMTIVMLLGVAIAVFSEVPIVKPNLHEPTGIATSFFGPNAFPVPDMLDGRTQGTLDIELTGDGFFGYAEDWTADIFARVRIPMWTPRVNLSVWMPVMEWYSMTPQRQNECRVHGETNGNIKGHEAGDVYISTDIQMLKAKRWKPDIAIRAALKTASGGSFHLARYYDNPGYFFDLAVGKSLYLVKGETSLTSNPNNSVFEIRLSGNAGFLCWQTDNGRQNDAVMYGAQLFMDSRYIALRATYGGYVGWEKAGDRPMTVKLMLAGHIKNFEPYAQYQYGINDYPFHMIRIGLVYHADILKNK